MAKLPLTGTGQISQELETLDLEIVNPTEATGFKPLTVSILRHRPPVRHRHTPVPQSHSSSSVEPSRPSSCPLPLPAASADSPPPKRLEESPAVESRGLVCGCATSPRQSTAPRQAQLTAARRTARSYCTVQVAILSGQLVRESASIRYRGTVPYPCRSCPRSLSQTSNAFPPFPTRSHFREEIFPSTAPVLAFNHIRSFASTKQPL